MKLSIIVPLYNEEELILIVLERLQKINFPESVKEYEIIIVDDCSKDNSFEIVSKYIQDKPFCRLLKHNINLGKGAAVRYGFKEAKGDVFLIQDSDLELVPEDIPKLIDAMIMLNIQFVNGSRYMPGVIRPISSYRRYVANRFFTFLTSLLINVKLSDMACGYKLIHKDLINKIKLNENRFGFEAELILKALRIKKNNIAEVPIQYFPRNSGEGKKLKNIDGFKILWTIIKYGLLKLN